MLCSTQTPCLRTMDPCSPSGGSPLELRQQANTAFGLGQLASAEALYSQALAACEREGSTHDVDILYNNRQEAEKRPACSA